MLRVLFCCLFGTAAGAPAPISILPPAEQAVAAQLLGDLTEWIMGLDLGGGEVKHYDHGSNALNQSIFINGNLARVLMGSYRLTGNTTHLIEALRWCDAFVAQQVPVATSLSVEGGFWGTGSPTLPLAEGEIYLGDTGTATALAYVTNLVPIMRSACALRWRCKSTLPLLWEAAQLPAVARRGAAQSQRLASSMRVQVVRLVAATTRGT